MSYRSSKVWNGTLTGFKKSAFENLGKPCVIVVICDDAEMNNLLGKLTQGAQRALRKSAIKSIEDNFETYSAMSVFWILEKHVCQNCIQPIRDALALAKA